MLPHWIMRDSDLTRDELLVYWCFLDHRDHVTEVSKPTREQVADECRMSKKAVTDAVAGLMRRHLIVRINEPRKPYRFFVPEPPEEAPNAKLEKGARTPKRVWSDPDDHEAKMRARRDGSLIDQWPVSEYQADSSVPVAFTDARENPLGTPSVQLGTPSVQTEQSESPELGTPSATRYNHQVEPEVQPEWVEERDERVPHAEGHVDLTRPSDDASEEIEPDGEPVSLAWSAYSIPRGDEAVSESVNPWAQPMPRTSRPRRISDISTLSYHGDDDADGPNVWSIP
jgi:hypothetical protein